MFTVNFQVPALRPDYARFDTEQEARNAVRYLTEKMHAGRPIRVNIRHRGVTLLTFERK